MYANNFNQTVNDGVAHSKNPRKFAYHVTFDLDLEHILDARSSLTRRPSCASLVAIQLFAWEKKRYSCSDFRASTKLPVSRDLCP